MILGEIPQIVIASLRRRRSNPELEVVMKQPAIYIMTNMRNGTLYTGVTSNLGQRVYQHKNEFVPGFTSRYQCKNLVYFEIFSDMENAIMREKKLKGGPRKQKLKLIESLNPEWKDLYESICK